MASRTLTAKQKEKFEQLKSNLPTDLVPGYSVTTTGTADPESSFVKGMKRFSEDMATNAYAYFNYQASGKGPLRKRKRKPSRIISPDGFPPNVTITYAYPPPFAFSTPNEVRNVKHFVIHSFGHAWHATSRAGKKIGWMNSSKKHKGVVAHTLDDRTVYVPKGSDPETLTHFTRFAAGLRACLGSAAKATAHFFIDRSGNILIVGDCNDIMYTSQGVSKTSVGVELEEAFYVVKDTKGKGDKALWRPGGNPPGTAGNVEYFSYSPEQLLTLSVLCKKLELVYPDLRERTVKFVRQGLGPEGPPGYTMHDYIRGSKHIDVSPHFRDQAMWDSFFELVDSHTHINPTNVFRPTQKWRDSGKSFLATPLSANTVTAMTDRLLQGPKVEGTARDRTAQIANVSRASVNSSAGDQATLESNNISKQAAVTTQLMQQTQSFPMDLPSTEQFTSDSGVQEGSDYWW